MKRGDELTVHVEGFAFEGKSVARIDGMVIFVNGAVPGDTAKVRITKVKKQFLEAATLAIDYASPLRVEPRCQYFGVCGGCKWQHVNYQEQLKFKRQHVIDALERIGGFRGIKVNEIRGADEVYFYRNKMEFSFGDRWLTQEEMERRSSQMEPDELGRFALGLHVHGRFFKVLDIDECWLQSEISPRIVNAVRSFSLARRLPTYSTFTHHGYLRNLVIREGKRTGDLMVNLVTSDDRPDILEALRDDLLKEFPDITTIVNNITDRKSQVAIGEVEKVYYGPGYITEQLDDKTYRISANTFFQTNTAQAERLFDIARRIAHLNRSDVVFALYSGAGTIALFVADDVAEVVGIEAVEAAIKDARRNAVINNVSNCTFVHGELRSRLTNEVEWLEHHPRPHVMFIDPPRSGMHEKVIRQILALRPERIVYISCNPTTQARDLKLLCNNSVYSISQVQPIDMFPHTYHIENVVGLSLTARS